jgi:hypothetical protein
VSDQLRRSYLGEARHWAPNTWQADETTLRLP